nr:winged helix-turn-helix domain-containing protein [Streptomyces caniscabiei]
MAGWTLSPPRGRRNCRSCLTTSSPSWRSSWRWGPSEHGWEDQRWTLARIRALIAWKFGIDCSSAGVWRLLHRHGWSWQSPARRALERDEHAVELWKKDVWPQVE